MKCHPSYTIVHQAEYTSFFQHAERAENKADRNQNVSDRIYILEVDSNFHN